MVRTSYTLAITLGLGFARIVLADATGTSRRFAEIPFDCISNWSMPTNAAAAYFAHESFRSMMPECFAHTRRNADGTVTLDLDHLNVPFKQSLDDGRRFSIAAWPRVSVQPGTFYDATFRHDMPAYRKWLDAHPGFQFFEAVEMANDAYIRWRCPDEILKRKNDPVSDETYKRLTSAKPPATREGYVREVLKPHFERVVEWCCNDRKHLMAGDGQECEFHLYGYWGAGVLGMETTQNFYFWQILLMHCRGAARQFNLPWHWYLASYNGPYNTFSEHHPEWKTMGPDYGLSHSAMRRGAYMTWLAGAHSYEREAMGNTHFLPVCGNGAISEEGKMYDEFWRFTRTHERGVPVVPIALLVPYARGYSVKCGPAFAVKYTYTHADRMMDAVMSTILDFPQNRDNALLKNDTERVMCNSRYGDVFDVIVPDFPDQTSFRRTIGQYKAAVLIGDYGRNSEMEAILRDYVANGGILVLNAAQLGGAFDETFAGAVPPLGTAFVSHRFGKGEVMLCPRPYLTEWYGDTDAGREKAIGEICVGAHPIRHPEIERIFDAIEEKVVPVRVSGSIQWGLNKTRDGWLVYLVNNAGVIKPGDKPEKLLDGSDVEIDLSRLPHVSAHELLTDRDLGSGDAVRLHVAAGGLAIVRVSAH